MQLTQLGIVEGEEFTVEHLRQLSEWGSLKVLCTSLDLLETTSFNNQGAFF